MLGVVHPVVDRPGLGSAQKCQRRPAGGASHHRLSRPKIDECEQSTGGADRYRLPEQPRKVRMQVVELSAEEGTGHRSQIRRSHEIIDRAVGQPGKTDERDCWRRGWRTHPSLQGDGVVQTGDRQWLTRKRDIANGDARTEHGRADRTEQDHVRRRRSQSSVPSQRYYEDGGGGKWNCRQTARQECSCEPQEDRAADQPVGGSLFLEVPLPENKQVKGGIHEWERQQLHVAAGCQGDQAASGSKQQTAQDPAQGCDVQTAERAVEDGDRCRGGEGVYVLLALLGGFAEAQQPMPQQGGRLHKDMSDVPEIRPAVDLVGQLGDVMVRKLAVQRDIEATGDHERDQCLSRPGQSQGRPVCVDDGNWRQTTAHRKNP